MPNIRLPHNWQPRDYQKPAWSYLEHGGKRALLFWHRRSGKDDVALHHTACKMAERVGTYWHMLPEGEQARKAIWEAVNPNTAKRRIDEAFPVELRAATRDTDMFIRMKNGSTWQVVGSDNYDSLVGSPPVGVVGSEWALSKPAAWAYLRPVLAENGGWALFITTPRGKNHAHRLLQTVKDDPFWFTQILTALQTGVFTPEMLLREQRELKGEHGEAIGRALYRQEYMCEFDAPVVGAIYPEEIMAVRDSGRLARVPHDPKLPVKTYWDLGFGDRNAIWITQQRYSEVRCIDYLEGNKKGVDWYATELAKRPYAYAEHWLPHDGASGHVTDGKSPASLLKKLMPATKVYVAPRLPVETGIKLVRAMFPRVVFDEAKTEEGFDGLVNYRRAVSKSTTEESSTIVHDWASHPADAFRTLAVALEEPAMAREQGDGGVDDLVALGGAASSHGWMST
ncbi:MAG: hypothetical protein IT493_12010 [Gammaproteobacteria bacterium]|nr:hypothetical protein [Gammaproteobacteria bacterium]